jgi:hypothetical protein
MRNFLNININKFDLLKQKLINNNRRLHTKILNNPTLAINAQLNNKLCGLTAKNYEYKNENNQSKVSILIVLGYGIAMYICGVIDGSLIKKQTNKPLFRDAIVAKQGQGLRA